MCFVHRSHSEARSLRRAADLSRGPPPTVPGAVRLRRQRALCWLESAGQLTLNVCSVKDAGDEGRGARWQTCTG
jgi:hypothetical protein